jgi:hypothetical protein
MGVCDSVSPELLLQWTSMSLAQAQPRTAIAQIRMHWTIEANLAAIVAALHMAHRHVATLCAFSELAVTGFHRDIVSLAFPHRVDPAIAQIQALCAGLSIARRAGCAHRSTRVRAGCLAPGPRPAQHHRADQRAERAESTEESVDGGQSRVISPACELLFRLPRQASGLGLFTLGERQFDWHPLP